MWYSGVFVAGGEQRKPRPGMDFFSNGEMLPPHIFAHLEPGELHLEMHIRSGDCGHTLAVLLSTPIVVFHS